MVGKLSNGGQMINFQKIIADETHHTGIVTTVLKRVTEEMIEWAMKIANDMAWAMINQQNDSSNRISWTHGEQSARSSDEKVHRLSGADLHHHPKCKYCKITNGILFILNMNTNINLNFIHSLALDMYRPKMM